MIILLAFNTKLPQSFEPLLSGHSDKTDEIRRSFLAVCIKTYVTDPNLKACAERAAWLGNGGDLPKGTRFGSRACLQFSHAGLVDNIVVSLHPVPFPASRATFAS